MIVTLTASDPSASLACYDAALGALGWVRVIELVDEEEDAAPLEAAGWGPAGADAQLWVVTGPTASRGVHLRLPAASRVEVETFYSAATTAGATAVSAPRRWTPYRRGEFTATVRDPDGNLIEAAAPE